MVRSLLSEFFLESWRQNSGYQVFDWGCFTLFFKIGRKRFFGALVKGA